MKLSELIRKGAEQTTQKMYNYVETDSEGNVCACALGAAVIACVGKEAAVKEPWCYTKVKKTIRKHYGINLSMIVECPVTGKHSELGHVIIDLNDFHRWSIKEIVDWLELQES